MRNSKFKKGQTAYQLILSVPMHDMKPFLHAMGYREIYVRKVENGMVYGTFVEHYGRMTEVDQAFKKSYSTKHFGGEMTIITKKKLEDLSPHDMVSVSWRWHVGDLKTMEEVKAEMIKWIANDFEDPTDESHLHP